MDAIIGIDVGRGRPDAFRSSDGRRLAVGNDQAGVAELAGWGGEGAPFVMEASGGHERAAHRGLLGRARPARVDRQRQAGARLREGEPEG